MQRDSFSSWMMSLARYKEEFYDEGKLTFGKGAPDLAVGRFATAIKLCKPDTAVTEQALYYACRARANVRIKDYLKGELDSLCAVRLIVGKDHASYELETTLYDEWLSLIEEWQEALSEARDEGTFSAARIRTLLSQLEPLVDKIDDDLSHTPRPRPPSGTISRSAVLALPDNLLDPSDDEVTLIESSSRDSTTAEKLHTIYTAHNALKILWDEKKEDLVAAWKRIPEEPDRLFLCADALGELFEEEEDWDKYPELEAGNLYLKNNLLDLVFARATRSPPVSAFHLDLPATTSYKPRDPSLASLSLNDNSNGEYMLLTDDPYGFPYGTPLPSTFSTLPSLVANSEACPLAVGEAVLDRQRLSYLVALRGARLLYFAASNPQAQRDWRGGGGISARELWRRFEKMREYKARAYVGREEWEAGRLKLSAALFSLPRKAQEYVERIKTEAYYVHELLLDSLTSQDGRVHLAEAKGTLRRLIFNAHARYLLSMEMDEAFSASFGYAKNVGTSPSVAFPPDYERRIATFANVVDEYVKIIDADFRASVKGNYGHFANEDFDSLELHYTGLERLLGKAASINPLSSSTATWELLNVFGYIDGSVEYSEVPSVGSGARVVSTEIPSPLREIWEDYRDILRFRELLVDSHRPRFSREKANSFDRSIAHNTVKRFLLQPSSYLYESILNAFSDDVESSLNSDLDSLFNDLLTDFGNDKPIGLDYESSEAEESEVDSLELPALEEVEDDRPPTAERLAPPPPPSEQPPPPPPPVAARAPPEPSPYDAETPSTDEPATTAAAAPVVAPVVVPQLEQRDEARKRRPAQDVEPKKEKRWRGTMGAEYEAREAKKAAKKVKEKKREGVVGESKRPSLAPDVHFKVTRYALEGWESLLGGGKDVKRKGITLGHFVHALGEARFSNEPESGKGRKMHPGPVLTSSTVRSHSPITARILTA
ncbi:hypothetical protein JCM6882_002613 [Rhodosporidiobolus microsporus]